MCVCVCGCMNDIHFKWDTYVPNTNETMKCLLKMPNSMLYICMYVCMYVIYIMSYVICIKCK